MSELSALAGSEGYGTCDDDAQGETPWPERSDAKGPDIRRSGPQSQRAHIRASYAIFILPTEAQAPRFNLAIATYTLSLG